MTGAILLQNTFSCLLVVFLLELNPIERFVFDNRHHLKLIDGAYNTDKLKEFLEESWSSDSLRKNDILVMDNIRFHHSNIVKSWCEEKM